MDAANRQRTRTIENAIELLPSMIGEEFIYLKGADYSRRLYASPELRPQSDIDVLVPAHRFAGVATRLAQRFQPVYQAATHRSPRWPDRAYDLGGVTLELHHSFVQRSRARIDYDGVWQRRQPFMNAARVHDVDALLVSVINIAKDDLATTLLRYLDLWLMLRGDPSLFDAAARRAREWRIANAFHVVMRVTSELFPDLALPLRKRLLLDRLVSARSAARNRDRGKNVTRPQLLWRKLWLVDGNLLRAAFALDTAAMAVYGARQKRAPDESRNVRGR